MACGARTPLQDPDVDASLTPTCRPSAPLGAVAWRSTLTSERGLVGPLAADAQSDTFFAIDPALVSRPSSAPPTLLSLDRCGAPRWRVAWTHFQNRSVLVHGLVTQGRLLVGDGDLQAFDAATGAHLWTLDLVAYAAAQGLGDVTGSNALRRIVADLDGVAYALVQSRDLAFVLRVDATGAASTLLRVPTTPDRSSVGDLVLDAGGRLVFPLTFTNVSPGPGALYAFTRAGAMRYRLELPVVNYLDQITVGADYVLSGDTGTFVADDGSVRLDLGRFVGPGATSAAGELYTVRRRAGDDAGLAAYDARGRERWSAPLTYGYAFSNDAGPYLGQRNVWAVFTRFESARDGGTRVLQVLQAASRATGAASTFAFPGSNAGQALLLPAGIVVFTLDGDAVGVSTGGDLPADDALWPGSHGGFERRGAPRGL